MKNQKGFSAVEGLLILIIIGILGFVGWYVWSAKDKTSKSFDEVASSNNSTTGIQTLKEYKNTQYGFSFKYPSDWTFEEQFEDAGRGGKEGEVKVTSKNNTVVTFKGDYGGKGGSCEENPADIPHKTKNCNTIEVLDIEQISEKGVGNYPINLYKTRFTFGEENKSEYGLYVESGEYAFTKKGPFIGAYFNIGLTNVEEGIITSTVTGGDMSSADYFESVNGKEAIAILKTFRLL